MLDLREVGRDGILAEPRHWIPDRAQQHMAHYVGRTRGGEPFVRYTMDLSGLRAVASHGELWMDEIHGWSHEGGPAYSEADVVERAYGRLSARKADAALLAGAERVADAIRVEARVPVLEPSIVGSAPRVGAYLAGAPNSMIRSSFRPDAGRPRRVVVNLACTCTADGAQLRRRAMAAIALVEALAIEGGISLAVGVACTAHARGEQRYQLHTAHVIECGTSPLDRARLVGLLDTTYLYRGFLYGLERRTQGPRPDALMHPTVPQGELFGIGPGDVLIGELKTWGDGAADAALLDSDDGMIPWARAALRTAQGGDDEA